MSNTQTDVDVAFLNFVLERNVLTPLEAEALRSELRRKKATQRHMTMQSLLVHKGFLTQDQADSLFSELSNMLSQPTLLPDEDDTGRAPAPTQRPTERRPTGNVDAGARPTDRRPTDQLDQSQRPTEKKSGTGPLNERSTRPVEDSRTGTGGRSTTSRNTAKREKDDGWDLSEDSDALSATDKIVPAGTIIQASEMTIAMMRQKIGIDDGVKLVSDKMQSTLAQYQPDAPADKKRYVVVREIARGGMGKVLEVEDTELRRSVALKVLRKELLGRRDIVERFLEEAQITGQLEHPNIVPVHEMGVDGAGNLYFTMKFVEGSSLSEVLLRLREGNRDTQREYPLLRLLDVFIKICEGMAFAHNRGVIHRDLKPANIMVGRFGEVQVMDWGVAKVVGRQFRASENDSGIVLTDRLDSGSAHTMMGSVIGTPSYMSPEQAKGEVDTINHTSDIFSLGVILYEMLCLRSPWTGKSSDEVLEQVREMTPMKPRERNPEKEVPGELERLALKCLEKDPVKRLDTVKELAENVRNFIEGRAMGSVDYSPMRLAMKWIGRNKKEVLGVMLTLLAVFAGIFGTIWYIDKLEQEKILGLSDDAKVLMAEWEDLAKDGKFSEAEEKLDGAKNLYQKVLVVDEEDAAALEGLQDVDQASDKIRDLRTKADKAKALREQRERLVSEGRNALTAGMEDKLFGFRLMETAYAKAAAALALDKENKEARLLQVEAANERAKVAGQERDWDIMKFWIERMSRGEMPSKDWEKELDERLFEYRRGTGE
ncbi:MAG: protein kinase [Planctomycetes bacterium]|nr:protein kinase [Planctomycetota bacterium]